MKSVWSDVKIEIASLKKLPVKTDVLIVGGGMAGLLCADRLRKQGVSCIVAEANTIGSGTTKNTTAKITSQHGLIYSSIAKRFGTEYARLYYDANQHAVEQFCKMCIDIDCDFEEKSAFVYSLSGRNKIEAELRALDEIGAAAKFKETIPLPFKVSGAIEFENQAQFHPLKFISEIAKGADIIEKTRVIDINGHYVRTNRGDILADKIIVTSHFPFINTRGSYFLKLYQSRSYVAAYENAPLCDGMYVDEADNGMSFRSYKNLLLIGGGGHRTGKSGKAWHEIAEFARVHYPNAIEKYRWAAQDCMSLDSVPYIGNYSKNTPHLYVASGFNKWGMTGSMVSAMVLSDLITGRHNEFAPLFSPSRSILRPQLAINAFEATIGLLTPTVKRCPHLGCALKWNKYEHSWDCSCHGSRFDENGKLIDNPATGNLRHR